MAVLEEVDDAQSEAIKAQQAQLQLARDRKQWLGIFSSAFAASDVTAVRYAGSEYYNGCQAAMQLADEKRACLAAPLVSTTALPARAWAWRVRR